MKLCALSILICLLMLRNFGLAQDVESSSAQQNDKQAIQSVVKNLYRWLETERRFDDFVPVSDPEQMMYIGIDSAKHGASLNELRASHFFSEEFLSSYDSIALNLNYELETKKLEWFVGELPPFGNDANPWCNCQDPPENFWERIELLAFSMDNNIASFAWTWGDGAYYQMQATKQVEKWRITHMQGFATHEFLPEKTEQH